MAHAAVVALGIGALLARDEGTAAQAPVVPEFGDPTERALVVIGDQRDGLDAPRDLAFHPGRPYELWTVNRNTDGTVIYFDPGTAAERVEDRKDSHRNHFMEEVSSIAFGDMGHFAT